MLRSRRQPVDFLSSSSSLSSSPSNHLPSTISTESEMEHYGDRNSSESSPMSISPSPSPPSSSSTSQTTSLSSSPSASSVSHLLESELECSLCYRVFYQPVTTPCGHTYCKECIATSLNYNLSCPLCRRKLLNNHADFSVNITLSSIIEKHFADSFKEREEEEMRLSKLEKEHKTNHNNSVHVPEETEIYPTCVNWSWGLLCDV